MAVCLVADPEVLGQPAVGKGFAAWRGGAVLDGNRLARAAWGVLGEDLSDADADACKAAFEANGVGVRVLAALPPLPEAVDVTAVDACAPAGLRLVAGPQRRGDVAFADVVLVAAAVVTEIEVRTEEATEGPSAGARMARAGITMATGIPLPGGKAKKVEKRVEQRTEKILFDLFLRGGRRLRFKPAALDYSFLGAEKAYGVMPNFRQLLVRVSAGAAQAGQSRGAAFLLAGRPAAQAGYDGAADYERECRWRLALLATA